MIDLSPSAVMSLATVVQLALRERRQSVITGPAVGAAAVMRRPRGLAEMEVLA
jgi:hypothetical protein